MSEGGTEPHAENGFKHSEMPWIASLSSYWFRLAVKVYSDCSLMENSRQKLRLKLVCRKQFSGKISWKKM